MTDYLAYESEEDQAALNARYEKIPTPAEGEELESSDDEELNQPEDVCTLVCLTTCSRLFL